MPGPVRSFALAEFTGGLNLRADQFQMAENESPDMCNVDVDPRGGFALRAGVTYWNDPADATIDTLGAFYDDGTGDVQIIIGQDTDIQYWDSTAWDDIVTDNTAGHPSTMAQFKGPTDSATLYLTNRQDFPISWDGTTAIRLGNAWSNDIAAPTDGNAPKGLVNVAHNGHMFTANTVEPDGSHYSRIRWSHINKPEAWREVDYWDVDIGVDGDEIIALQPHGDHLLIFKRQSVHVMYGFDTASFTVQTISRELGAVSQNAVCATPQGVYFFSQAAGLMFYDGRGVHWAFDKLVSQIESGGDIDLQLLDTVDVGYAKNRVWLTVPLISGGRTTYVLDPSLSKSGAWTKFDLDFTLVTEIRTEEVGTLPLAVYDDQLIQLERQGQPYDVFGDWTQPADTWLPAHSIPFLTSGYLGDRATPDPTPVYDRVEYDGNRTAIVVDGVLEVETASATDNGWGMAADVESPAATVGAFNGRSSAKFVCTNSVEAAVFGVNFTNDPTTWTPDDYTDGCAIYGIVSGGGLGFTCTAYYDVGAGGVSMGVVIDTASWTTMRTEFAKLTWRITAVDTTTDITFEVLDASMIAVASATVAPHASMTTLMTTSANLYSFLSGAGAGVQEWLYETWGTPARDYTQTHIDSHYTTPWIDAGNVATRKRWKRPRFVFTGTGNDRVQVEVFKNYDGGKVSRTFYKQVARTGTSARWDAFFYDDGEWETDANGNEIYNGTVWATEGQSHALVKGSTLGLSNSTRLRLTGPLSNTGWGCDNITFAYVERRLR